MQKKLSLITLCGPSNAGKSTLLNQIIGNKIAAVSHKVQTTRNIIRGIYTEGDVQLVFSDTPGIFNPKSSLEKLITKNAWNQIREAHVNCLIIDASNGITPNVKKLIEHFKDKNYQNTLVIINKVDLVKKPKLLEMAQELMNLFDFKKLFMISANNGDGVHDIVKYFIDSAEESDFLYDENLITDLSNEFLAAEITREKIFNSLSRELPYSVTIETEKFEDTEDGLQIHQVIYVAKETHKKIVIGKKGETIKNIGTQARKDLEDIFARHINLKLFVKVKEDWLDKPDLYVNNKAGGF